MLPYSANIATLGLFTNPQNFALAGLFEGQPGAIAPTPVLVQGIPAAYKKPVLPWCLVKDIKFTDTKESINVKAVLVSEETIPNL
jgi:hypothetical protein